MHGSEVRKTAEANPLDKFQLGIPELIEDFMILRMSDNDNIVTKYMEDLEFKSLIFPILSKDILDAVREVQKI